MAEYKTIKDLELEGKRVLVRLDLNVPIKEGKIKDFTRIDASLKTIKYIIENNGKAILMSHLGRPEGKKNPELSLKLVAEAISEKIGKDVTMAPDCVGVEGIVDSMEKGDVVLLENLRFHAGEEENDPGFVDSLVKLADAYVNDAFGTAHRAHASTYGVALKLIAEGKDAAAGFLMDEELETWKPVVESSGDKVAVVGGAKLKEKMKAVKKLAKKFNRIIVGGVAANVFMKAAGYDIGDSLYLEKGKDYTDAAKEVLDKNDNVILPSKVVVATTDFERTGEADPKEGVEKGKLIADVLPSSEDISAIKDASNIVWFGPLGVYEKGFKDGSLMVVKAIGESSGYAVIGGGDLAAAAAGVKAKVSTGGGASIQYITSGKLEALEALKGKSIE
jgi:phosphoglycerate kinase